MSLQADFASSEHVQVHMEYVHVHICWHGLVWWLDEHGNYEELVSIWPYDMEF